MKVRDERVAERRRVARMASKVRVKFSENDVRSRWTNVDRSLDRLFGKREGRFVYAPAVP